MPPWLPVMATWHLTAKLRALVDEFPRSRKRVRLRANETQAVFMLIEIIYPLNPREAFREVPHERSYQFPRKGWDHARLHALLDQSGHFACRLLDRNGER
jgi:hypothetical protein